MELVINILSILTCLWIIWDDFSNREIHIFAVVILAIQLAFKRYFYHNITIENSIIETGINLSLLLVIFGITYAFFKWARKVKQPTESHIGVGDFLFFIALIFVGSPMDFVFLFVGLSILSLIVGIVGVLFLKWKNIPYAGISAVFFVALIVLEENSISLTTLTNSLLNNI